MEQTDGDHCKCDGCKKQFYYLHYNMDEYVYKIGVKTFCSYNCRESYRKAHPIRLRGELTDRVKEKRRYERVGIKTTELTR